MLKPKPMFAPLEPGIHFYKRDLPSKEEVAKDKHLKLMQQRYWQVVGTFIFVCGTRKPDIMYAVHVLCRSKALRLCDAYIEVLERYQRSRDYLSP
jgi:hypothetical protein